MKLIHHPKRLYVLYRSQLFGTERMAIAMLPGLRDDFDRMLLGTSSKALA